ncbi:MAG TPA: DUF4870 domain-containing protein [Pseudomonadales bacterium]|nr:DUF4870 domain-containing protein [Pseudomonadales bacterium]
MENNDSNTPIEPTPEAPLPAALSPSQDSKNLALLCWIGSAILGFIPGLAFYLTKKDDAYVQDQAKEALNWGITFLLLLIVGKVLLIVLIGFIVIPLAWGCHLLFCIMGAVSTSDGKPFRVPFALRLIK